MGFAFTTSLDRQCRYDRKGSESGCSYCKSTSRQTQELLWAWRFGEQVYLLLRTPHLSTMKNSQAEQFKMYDHGLR